jgi:hypothetical protein
MRSVAIVIGLILSNQLIAYLFISLLMRGWFDPSGLDLVQRFLSLLFWVFILTPLVLLVQVLFFGLILLIEEYKL